MKSYCKTKKRVKIKNEKLKYSAKCGEKNSKINYMSTVDCPPELARDIRAREIEKNKIIIFLNIRLNCNSF